MRELQKFVGQLDNIFKCITVGAIIIWSLADFVGFPTYKEFNCV